MRTASSSGEGDRDRVSHPKRIGASEQNLQKPKPLSPADRCSRPTYRTTRLAQGHGLRHREALECRAAELGGVVVAIGVERPAPFPGVYGTSQRSRVSNRFLYLFDDRIGMTIRECDSGVGESHYCCLEGGA